MNAICCSVNVNGVEVLLGSAGDTSTLCAAVKVESAFVI